MWRLASGHVIGGLLQLDKLLVRKFTAIVDDPEAMIRVAVSA